MHHKGWDYLRSNCSVTRRKLRGSLNGPVVQERALFKMPEVPRSLRPTRPGKQASFMRLEDRGANQVSRLNRKGRLK